MTATDPALSRARLAALPRWRPSEADIGRYLPVLIALAVLAGLVFALAVSPIGSGDYGQWLMTSRRFLGESVPSYRNLDNVPPVVPALLANIRVLAPDPMLALHLLITVLLLALGGALFVLGTVAIDRAWGGVLALVIGLLVTDRFVDLFAFGGLLQIAALTFGCIAIAAIVRAAIEPLRDRFWLTCAAGALALTAITHVGTATIMVPIGLALAGMVAFAAFAREDFEPRPVIKRLLGPGLAFAAVGGYWLLVLMPATADYVANPASIAYRGPDRLWADLFGRWPTAVVAIVGAGALGFASLRALLRRRMEPMLLIATWALLAWGLLGFSLLSGSATDFPRFATPLILPLVVGAAAAVLWALQRLASWFGANGERGPGGLVIGVAVVVTVLVAAPLTVERYVRQAEFYELRDADSLADATAWLQAELPAGASVLADVREGKWIEGLTGHSALFAQPVRYAFRASEWQRSADADALLRSTLTLTSGYISAQFTDRVGIGPRAVPTGLVIRANHRGEFLDLLRIQPADVHIGSSTAASLLPVRSTKMVSEREAGLRTVWGMSGRPRFSFTQTTTVFEDGTTLRVAMSARARHLTTVFSPLPGTSLVSLDVQSTDAIACFAARAGSTPCLRFRATDEGRLSSDGAGGIQVRSTDAGVIDVLITALTAGNASVGLGLLDPADVAADHDVLAAVLYKPDPAYQGRVARLATLGFREARSFGPYGVLLREATSAP